MTEDSEDSARWPDAQRRRPRILDPLYLGQRGLAQCLGRMFADHPLTVNYLVVAWKGTPDA